jgi:C1A family cysteine protease
MASATSGCCSYHANPFDRTTSLVECPITYIDENACTSFYRGTWTPGAACTQEKYVYSGRPYADGGPTCGCSDTTNDLCVPAALHTARAIAMAPKPLSTSMSTPALYAAWRSKYMPRTALATAASPMHAAASYATFAKTVGVVKAHNSSPAAQNYTLALNKFADTPAHVFQRRFGFKRSLKRFPKTVSPMLATSIRTQAPIPTEGDWRLMSSVTNVKDQGSCGSCWAFSATAALEGFYARTTGKLASFATQPFLDCVLPSTNGCNGGEPADVFQYVLSAGKGRVCSFAAEAYTGEASSSTEDSDAMPYLQHRRSDDDTSPVDSCQYSACTVNVHPTAMHTIPVNDGDTLEMREDAFMRALVEHGPISAAVASQDNWSSYEKGVLTPDQAYTENDLNHAVLLVGYGVDAGKGFWIVKNSWSPTWGEGGYFRLPRGKGWSDKKWDNNGPFGMLSYSSPYLV